MKYILFSLVLIMSLSQASRAQVFNAQSHTLENGMQIVVIPNHRAPVVTHMVWYKVGAADEPPGLSGMAHYFEHLMFKGTDTLEPGEFSRIVKQVGGRDNAFTGQDYTAYFQSIPKNSLEQVMQMEADRMVNLNVPPAHFQSEKNVVLEERRQRTENDPKGLFYEQVKSALFVNHPYGTPIIGWMDEIEVYEWDDVKKFYDKWYAPNNAILVISGDVTLDEVKPLAEKIYGAIQPKDLPMRQRPNVPPAGGQTVMTKHHPTFHQPAFSEVFITPPAHSNKDDDLALQVLQDIMSAGANSRLYKSLVVEQKKAVSVNLSYRGDAVDYGTLWLSARPKPGVDIRELRDLVHAEIQKVIEDGVTQEEVSDAISRLQDTAIFARDSLQGPAMTFGFALSVGKTINDVEYWPQDIETVTPEQVQAAAQKYLNPDSPWHRPSVVAYTLPEKTQEAAE